MEKIAKKILSDTEKNGSMLISTDEIAKELHVSTQNVIRVKQWLNHNGYICANKEEGKRDEFLLTRKAVKILAQYTETGILNLKIRL